MTLPAPGNARVRMRSAGVPGPRGGGVYVSELQRVRLLDAAFAVVSEDGYRRLTARRVSGRAGVSNKTFYDLFEDREDCFLAAFDHAVDEIAGVVLPEWEGESEWSERVRAALGALLGFLDGEPALRRLVFVEALGGGPRVLERRARVLEDLESVIDEGRAGVKAGRVLPPLTAEGVVGAAFSVIHPRLLQRPYGSLSALLGPLMATIVLAYRGHEAAARELARPVSQAGSDFLPTDKPAKWGRSGGTSGSCADFRPTVRTQMVLVAVAELGRRGSHPNNRQVADGAGISDQGQISKLLARLEGVGLSRTQGATRRVSPGRGSSRRVVKRSCVQVVLIVNAEWGVCDAR